MEPSELDRLLNDGNEKPFDFRAVLYSILERLWVVVLIWVLVAIAGFVYLSRSPLIFAARTVLMFEQESSKVVKVEGVKAEDLRSAELLNTMMQSIQSREVLQRVVHSLNLGEDAEFLTGTGLTHVSPAEALGLLQGALKVELRKATRLVDVVVEHRKPEVAAKLADAVAREFLRSRLDRNSKTTEVATEFLNTESDRLKIQLRKSEEALHQYKVDQNAFALEENQNTIVAQLKDFSARMTQTKSERMRLEGDVGRAKELAGKPGPLLALPSIASNANVASLTEAIAAKESQLSVLSLDYKPKHPQYIAAQTELESLRARRQDAVLKAADLLQAELRNVQETEAGLVNAEAEQQKKAAELNQKAIQYNALTREMESNRAMYQSVLNRVKETDVTNQWTEAPVRIAEPAYAYAPDPARQNEDHWRRAWQEAWRLASRQQSLCPMLDSSIKTVDETEKLLGLPILSAVPRRKITKNLPSVGLAMIDEPKGPVAESFRTLRSSLSLLGRREQRRTFLFTSAIPAEGKSFTCCNYAVVSAQMGVRTLLIDADLRRPAISSLFFGEKRKPGLADCLAGQAGLQNAAIPTEIPNLTVLPAGSTAPNPAELLASTEFAAIIQEALLLYDRVIVDTAPVNAVSDTLVLAPHVQTICLVIRAGSTPRKAAMRAAKALTDIQCKPAGVVLNYLPERHGIGYYYYYYSGEYGTAGVYGAKAELIVLFVTVGSASRLSRALSPRDSEQHGKIELNGRNLERKIEDGMNQNSCQTQKNGHFRDPHVTFRIRLVM